MSDDDVTKLADRLNQLWEDYDRHDGPIGDFPDWLADQIITYGLLTDVLPPSTDNDVTALVERLRIMASSFRPADWRSEVSTAAADALSAGVLPPSALAHREGLTMTDDELTDLTEAIHDRWESAPANWSLYDCAQDMAEWLAAGGAASLLPPSACGLWMTSSPQVTTTTVTDSTTTPKGTP